jgi:aconitate hydratase
LLHRRVEIACDIHKLVPRSSFPVTLRRAQSGQILTVEATALLDTTREIHLIQSGGIIPMILERALAESHARTGGTAA